MATSGIRTVGEALDRCRELVRARVEHSAVASRNIEAHETLPDDLRARRVVRLLLPRSTTAVLFREVCSSVDGLRRARALFGPPPYNFLWGQPAIDLNAQGFAFSRRNLAHARTCVEPSSQSFGIGQLCDRSGRVFTVNAPVETPTVAAILAWEPGAADELPIRRFLRGDGGEALAWEVYVRASSKKQARSAPSHGADALPMVGEALELELCREAADLLNLPRNTSSRARVRSIVHHIAGSATATLLCVRMAAPDREDRAPPPQ